MATDREMEKVVGALYPRSMRHLQQLIMDAESCAKAYGKKSIFGKDKFEPAFDSFMGTVGKCVVSLAIDGHIDNPEDAEASMDVLQSAMMKCEAVYSSWPLGFQFWRDWYKQFKAKTQRERGA